MIHFAIQIDLRSTTTAGTDKTIYAATREISLDDGSGLVQVPSILKLQSQFVNQFGRVDDRLQIPQRLGVFLNNQTRVFNDFLPIGSDPQFWDLSEVTVYDISRANDGDLFSSLNKEFVGFISPSTLIYPVSLDVIEFDVLDRRVNTNKPIAATTFGDNPNFVSGVNDDVQGTIAPQILGDWTDGTQRIPAFLISSTGGAVYAVCNHEIGTLTVERNGTPIVPIATDLANGTFTLVGPVVDTDIVTVQCVGHPTLFTDANPVRLIQNVLKVFGGIVDANIFNPVGDAPITTNGSFEFAYNQVGGTTPDYKTRAYINNETDLALDVAARIAFEANFAITVDSNTDQYNIFWEIPSAPESVQDISRHIIDNNVSVTFESDPDEIYANAGKVSYGINPAESANTTRQYDSIATLPGTHPIEVSRANFGIDVEFVDTFDYIYDDAGVQIAVNRRLIWRSSMPQEVTMTIDNNLLDGLPWDITLNSDFQTDFEALPGSYRINRITKDPESGQISLRGRSLITLPTAGRWNSVDEFDSHWTDDLGVTPTGTAGYWI